MPAIIFEIHSLQRAMISLSILRNKALFSLIFKLSAFLDSLSRRSGFRFLNQSCRVFCWICWVMILFGFQFIISERGLGHKSLSIIVRSQAHSNSTKCLRPRLGHPRSFRHWDPGPAPFKSSLARKTTTPTHCVGVVVFQCAREDLNLHTRRHTHLKGACIPISPLAHIHYLIHRLVEVCNSRPSDYTYFWER